MFPRAFVQSDEGRYGNNTKNTNIDTNEHVYGSVKAANLWRARNDTTPRFKRLGEIGGGEKGKIHSRGHCTVRPRKFPPG